MIFGVGLFIFVVALLISWGQRPQSVGVGVATAGLTGIVLMLVSICVLIARWLP